MKPKARKAYAELTEALEKVGDVPCQNAPDLFFADEDDVVAGAVKSRYARILCGDCPVRTLCAAYAIEANEVFGIWGGLSVHDRVTIRKVGQPGIRVKSLRL